jgi:hypothetical protein
MFLLILGFIIFILGIIFRKIVNLAKYARGFIIGGLVAMIIGISLSCFIQIDAGHVGVKKLFGKVQPDVLESGTTLYQSLVRGRKNGYKNSKLHYEWHS